MDLTEKLKNKNPLKIHLPFRTYIGDSQKESFFKTWSMWQNRQLRHLFCLEKKMQH